MNQHKTVQDLHKDAVVSLRNLLHRLFNIDDFDKKDEAVSHVEAAGFHIYKAGFILKSAHESNHEVSAHLANTMLGEVPTSAQASTSDISAADTCETGAVRQNEQTKEVCPECESDNVWVKNEVHRCDECREIW